MGAKPRNLTGLTLLFVGDGPKGVEGIVESYVVRCSSLDELRRIGERIGAREEATPTPTNTRLQYIGIEDVFEVVGPVDEGAILGRTSLWDCDRRALAEDLVQEVATDEDVTTGCDWYLASAVYFVARDADGDAYAIAAKVMIRCAPTVDAWTHAHDIASSELVLRRVLACGPASEPQPVFVGLEGLQSYRGDPMRGSPFEVLGKPFASPAEVERLLPDDEEIRESFAAVSACR